MSSPEAGHCVAIVGAGAAGALTAAHLVSALSQRYRVVLWDPASTTGHGVAYATADDRHLLNVPAGNMSALPRDPDHFLRWLRRHHDPQVSAEDFVPRHLFGTYVETLLESATQFPGNARLERRYEEVTGIRHHGDRFVVRSGNGDTVDARAVVLATGSRANTSWAPTELLATAPGGPLVDAWADELPDGDLLLVGTGLTMVDIAIRADRPHRTLHTVSRHDLLPRVHRSPARPPAAPPPGITGVTDLEDLRTMIEEHVTDVREETGDWRPAIDGMRAITSQLWAGLDDAGKRAFLSVHARTWETHRHRMSPATAARLESVSQAGRLVRHRGTLLSGRPTATGAEVVISDGVTLQVLDVAAVVNCTGPDESLWSSPLLSDLARSGLVRPGPADLGIDSDADGRICGSLPRSTPFFTVGALRRGTLWETTAMPEIRSQAYEVAQSVVRALHGERRPGPEDLYGLALSTGAPAAAVYNDALRRLLCLQDGAEDGLRQAVDLDPGFTQAHAALALLDYEWGRTGSWDVSLSSAHQAAAAGRHLDDRELSFLNAVTSRLRDDEATGARSLLHHISLFPRDALAVSVAVPTVAFGGLTSGRQTADLVEALGRAYGDDWWYAGQLAFVRQDQERWGEAEQLASYALAMEPTSGHAVHARAHVYYETGQHAEGLKWLDAWIRTCGRGATYRSHFSWHAALHELVAGDVDAVRRRYARELAPPSVTGFRALVDSGSMLWRCRMADAPLETLDGPNILAEAPPGWLIRPPTAFAGLHVALGLAAAGDIVGLTALRTTCLAHSDVVFREVLAPVCRALQAMVDQDPARAVRELERSLPTAAALGGSAAQRDVLEETFLSALALSGQGARAATLLDRRLSRRPSPLDVRRRAWLQQREPSRSKERGGARRT